MYTNATIIVELRIAGKAVHVDLTGSDERLEWAYNDLASRLELLIETGVAKWYNARVYHFVPIPQADWKPAAVVCELKQQLRLQSP
jgi:hypothetical protein